MSGESADGLWKCSLIHEKTEGVTSSDTLSSYSVFKITAGVILKSEAAMLFLFYTEFGT